MYVTAQRFLCAVLLILCSGLLAWGQQGGQGGTGGSGGTGGQPAPGTGSRPPSRPIPPVNQPRTPDRERGIVFVSGRVVMDDGTPPTERVAIERVCGGVARKEGYTDSRGYFGFQLGWNLGVVQDASVGSTFDPFGRDQSSLTPGLEANTGVSQSELMNCDLRASLPGFRSNSLSLANRRPLEHNDVGMLVLYRMGAVQGTTISAASMQAPKDAKKAYKKGHELLGKNKPEEAQEHLERAVELYPKYADAWFDLGLTHEAQRQPDEAKKCYHEALAADSRYINPYWQLTLFSVRENNWKQVLELTDKALALNPLDYPLGHFYNAVANLYLQRLDAAEHSARKAQMLDGGNRIPKVHLLLGQILSQKGDYSAAAEQIRGYLKAEPKAQDAEKLKAEITRLEGLTNGAAKAKN